MPTWRTQWTVRIVAVFALLLVVAACTPGGQFDPTEVINLDTKKKIAGDREPLFPSGVPGAETGVPPDLVKGYKPPPDQAAESADAAASPVVVGAPANVAAAMPEKPKPKLRPKPKPKPQVARAPAQQKDSAWDQKPAQQQQQHDPVWDKASQPAQTNWPAPTAASQQAAQPAQTDWPAAPPASSQTNWPSPPPASTYSH